MRFTNLHFIVFALLLLGANTCGQVFQITVGNVPPTIGSITATQPVYIYVESTSAVWCNATAWDNNGYTDIKSITAVLWNPDKSAEHLPDDDKNHYSPSIVYQVIDGNLSKNFSSLFRIEPEAEPGTWRCKLTVMDTNGTGGYTQTNITFYSQSCSNDVWNPGEELVDCGGHCPQCLGVADVSFDAFIGQTSNGNLTLTSRASSDLYVNLSSSNLVSDGFIIDANRIALIPHDFVIQPGEIKNVDMMVSLPENATPGVYHGSITARTNTTVTATTNISLSVMKAPVPPSIGTIHVTYPAIASDTTETSVWCNATVSDENGYLDIQTITGVMWNPNETTIDSPDGMDHYSSAEIISEQLSDEAGLTRHLFSLQPGTKTGEWKCRLTAIDAKGTSGFNETTFDIYDQSCINGFLDPSEELTDCGRACPKCLQGDDVYVDVDAGRRRQVDTRFRSYTPDSFNIVEFLVSDLSLGNETNRTISSEHIDISPSSYSLGPYEEREFRIVFSLPEGIDKKVYNGTITAVTDTVVRETINMEIDVKRRGEGYMDLAVGESCLNKPVPIGILDEYYNRSLYGVSISVYLNERVFTRISTDVDGKAQFVPTIEGVYKIITSKSGYNEEEKAIDIVLCGLRPTCEDGIQNQNETGVDCGGLCPPCSCYDGIRNQGELSIDCGGPCLSCHCMDGVYSGDEIGLDCGGSCLPCPRVDIVRMLIINVSKHMTAGENFTLNIMDENKNPVQSLLTVKKPDGTILRERTDRKGKKTIYADAEGIWKITATRPGYVPVSATITVVTKVVQKQTSYLLALLILIGAVIYLRSRRIHIVSDAESIIKLVETDKIGNYKRIYVTHKVMQRVIPLVPEGILLQRELGTEETKEAEKLASDFGLNVVIAELLVLCDKIRAKRFLTGAELSDELIKRYKKVKIELVE